MKTSNPTPEQASVQLLKTYLQNTPTEELEAEWQQVKDVGFNGPTLTQVLSGTPIPPVSTSERPDTSQWGKDHWSLLAYCECRAVDHAGVLYLRHIRINDTKRGFSNGAYSFTNSWKPTHGTKLRDGSIPNPDHDDLDVLEELEAAGLVVNIATNLNPCVTITPTGFQVAHLIRLHGAAGGRYSTFEWNYPDGQ